MISPDYDGGSIVNLMASIEERLAGTTPGTILSEAKIPAAASYLVVLFDGLGDGQLAHEDAAPLAQSRTDALDTTFPTTTTTALASLATAAAPAEHGLLGYEMWLPEANMAVNTIHWTPVGGGSVVDIDFDAFLPSPNLWERLVAAGLEPVTVQPSNFMGSPMSRVLYRGCRYEPVDTYEDWLEAAVTMAAEPGRLVFAYFGAVDVAAHLKGQDSDEYRGSVRLAAALWERLVARMAPESVVIGTADHGHVDAIDRVKLPKELQEAGEVYGGGRVIFARNDVSQMAGGLPARWVDGSEVATWFGTGGRHPHLDDRVPAGALVANDGVRLLHKHSDKRLIGVHGGLSEAERRVPLLIGQP
ncbi:MAG: alkaline phosphatase family protein [Acidimicrobiia bacterium]|nr:alkaline phosphatase family protein [Acidimicrobiia bacterium]